MNTAVNYTPRIFLVVGAMTAGKSALLERLQRKKDLELAFFDMDAPGVPSTGRAEWRKLRVEQMFCAARENFQKNRSSVIFGLFFPEEIFKLKQYDDSLNLCWLLIDAPDTVLSCRLQERMERLSESHAYERVNENNLCIADKLRSEVLKCSIHLKVNSEVLTCDLVENKAVDFIQSQINSSVKR